MAQDAVKKREPVEKIGLRVILYSNGALTIAISVALIWLVLRYALLPNIYFRAAAVLILLLVIFYYVPDSIRQVYAEVKRRGG
jgi:hypothetical protein